MSEKSNISVREESIPDKVVAARDADETVAFMQAHDKATPVISKIESKRLTRKIMWRVLGLTILINTIMYMDKATLSYSSILGLWKSTGLDQNKYNNVNTLFYVGFAVGQIPGTFALQKLPSSKVLFFITFFWAVLVLMICVADNYSGIIALRFFLGFLEALAIPLLTTTNGMFMTRKQRDATQPIFYISCMASPIPIGFIAYGTIYLENRVSIPPYKVLHVIIGGLTLITAGIIWWGYPDNPVKCRFLTDSEKVWIIRRVQSTQLNTIEQKKFKKAHFFEALSDPISWLLTGFFLFQQLANNLPYQQTILFEEMGGMSNLNSTLITVAGAGYSILWAIFAFIILWKFPNTLCLCVIWSILPSWVGSIVAASLDIKNSIGMLAAICLASQSFGVSWICAYGLASSTAGSSYSKRLTRNAMMMVGYSVANIISPQLWQQKDAPRFVPAWIVQIVLSFSVAPGLIGIVWLLLSRRNKKRLNELKDGDRVGYVESSDGKYVAVDVAMLDMTDLQDTTFIYPT